MSERCKKLIEVALPLDAINKACVRENYIYRGNPSSLHKWWAQRPLAAARAVIFAQMVDDPSAHPDIFKTEKAQEKERKRLFDMIEELVLWENINNEMILQSAREEIWQSWRFTCAENADHLRARELFDRHKLPSFYDPFAGGGTLPLEAQRLGLESYASDLNPVAVLINKAMIEIPPKFAGMEPINPEYQSKSKEEKTLTQWHGAQGLAEDVRYYGQWMREEAEKRIGHLYPKVKVTEEMAKDRPDLKPYVGQKLTVVAWLWAHTVKSPNPAFAKVDVPLASTFMLSTKKGKEAYVQPVIDNCGYRFTVKVGKPKDTNAASKGTSAGKRKAFKCLISGVPIGYDYIRAEAKSGGMNTRLMAMAAAGDRERVYMEPTEVMEAIASQVKPEWEPEVEFFQQALGFSVGNYSMTKWGDLFTPRQLVALTTFSDLVQEIRERVMHDTLVACQAKGVTIFRGGECDASLYADAISLYLAFAVDKYSIYGNSLVPWYPKESRTSMLFGQQVLSMVWDYTEVNPFSSIGGSLEKSIVIIACALDGLPHTGRSAKANQQDAAVGIGRLASVVSTDPPYYDNIGYADLSDFFYVWLRRSLKHIFPDLFATLAVPKSEELVATPGRHGGKEKAEAFFLSGMTQAMHRLAVQAHPAFPVTIYYAFKQSDIRGNEGTASTGWATFLEAVIRAGFTITGTWPMRTERTGRVRDSGSNALASSIVIVCRPQLGDASIATRRDFLQTLKKELPNAFKNLQRGGIAPVDLAQAAIGPGMAVFTRYSKVIEADGEPMRVRTALVLINQTLDEVLAEQEGEFDVDTRWAIAWFEQYGMEEGPFGVAETLSKAKNTSVQGLVEAGILTARSGKVKLLTRGEMPADWDPATDERLTGWEAVQYLIRELDQGGEQAAAVLLKKLGSYSEIVRDLAYRLYGICERKKWATDAISYNSLVVAWSEITKLSQTVTTESTKQEDKSLFE